MHDRTVATFNHATADKVPGSNVRRIVDAVLIVAEVAVYVRNPPRGVWRATLAALRAFVATAVGPLQPLVIDF